MQRVLAILVLVSAACHHAPVVQPPPPASGTLELVPYRGPLEASCFHATAVINAESDLPDAHCAPRAADTTGAIDWATQSLVVVVERANISIAKAAARRGMELELTTHTGCMGTPPPMEASGYVVPKIATVKVITGTGEGNCQNVP